MQFWRYDVDEALCHMTEVWWRPTSRPVIMVVLTVTVGVLLLQRLGAV